MKNQSHIKIFQIGFNLTHTLALHNLFLKNGILSIFGDNGELAKTIRENAKSDKPMMGYEEYQAYFDMEAILPDRTPIYAYRDYLDDLYRCYPNAVYILNIGNIDDWIERRKALYGYLPKAMDHYNCDEEAVTNIWRSHYFEHIAKTKMLLADCKGFFIYDIDNCPLADLAVFLKQFEVALDASLFEDVKETRGSTDKKWHVGHLRESAMYFYYHLGDKETAIKLLEIAQAQQPCKAFYRDQLALWAQY